MRNHWPYCRCCSAVCLEISLIVNSGDSDFGTIILFDKYMRYTRFHGAASSWARSLTVIALFPLLPSKQYYFFYVFYFFHENISPTTPGLPKVWIRTTVPMTNNIITRRPQGLYSLYVSYSRPVTRYFLLISVFSLRPYRESLPPSPENYGPIRLLNVWNNKKYKNTLHHMRRGHRCPL